MTHYWRIRKYLPGRHGQLCRVLCTGAKNSVLVEFEDGFRVVTSRYFVRRVSKYRGHDTKIVNRVWVYVDTGEPVSENPLRPCGYCGRPNTPEGHDGCIGTLPNVMNACCGHGVMRAAYVQFGDGRRIDGNKALRNIERMTS